MSVPTNLIPTPITGLPEYLGTSTLGYLPYVLEGQTYKVQFGNIAAVGAVPSTRVIAAGTGLAGGGDLSVNRVISIAAGGVGFDQLASSGVTQGTYGSGSAIPVLTVDAKGRVTSATTAALDVTGFVPTSRTITAGSGLTGGGSLANNISLAANFSAATPLALGTASAGTAVTLSRGDHVHPAVNLSDTTQTQGALPLGRGGTGDALSPVAGAVVYSTGTKFALTNPGIAGQVLVSGGTDEPQWRTVEGAGTVTSVNASGGATGLSFTGGPITVSGTLTLGGTLAVANGGTGATTAAAARTNLSAAASGANTDITSIALTTGTISTSPVNGTDIVNKVYADSIASGINFHQSVRLATAAALPANTYNNGVSGVGATLTGNANGALSVDGVAAVAGNRILVKNEAAGANNGVYTVTQTGSGAAPYILTRATDFDSAGTGVDQIDAGDFFLVTAGSTQSNTSWVQQTPLPIVVGTTAIVFTQFAAPVLYSAGTGLTLAGTVFSLTAPVTVALGGTGTTTAFAAGSVVFAGASGVYTQKNSNFFWDNTNDRLGIGTVTPSATLDVNGNIVLPNSGIVNFKDAGGVNRNVLQFISGEVRLGGAGAGLSTQTFYTAAAERMRIDSSGLVGIGTASPAYKLHVTNTSGYVSAFRGTTAANSGILVGNTAGDTSVQTLASGDGFIVSDTGKYLAFGSNGVSERMRITAAGNVGIGASAPATRLHVEGADTELRVQSTTSSNGYIRFLNTSGSMSIGMSGAATNTLLTYDRTNSQTVHEYLGGASGYHYWATNGTERMRITNTGNVGIGTSSITPYFGTTARIYNAGNGGTLQVAGSSVTGGFWASEVLGLTSVEATTNHPLMFGTNATERMRIDTSGNVGIGTSAPNAKLNVSGGNITISASGTYSEPAVNAGVLAYDGVNGEFTISARSNGGSTYTRFMTSNGGTGAERMRITASGNVGIGTTTPGALLDVNGNATVRGNTTLGDAVGDLATIPDQLALEYTTDSLPATRPALSLDFVDVGALDPRVTFTRASTATFTGSNGLIQTAAVNAPRFDYDPVTLAAKGLLIEEARTNLLLYSAQFDNANWAKNSLTVTANATVAPDGTSTADKIIKDAVTTQASILQGLTTVVGAQTISFFAKAAEYDTVSFTLFNPTDNHVARGQVNLSTGAVIATQNGVVATQSFGNGWWRITATGTTTVAAGNALYIYPKDVTTYLGNGVDGIFIWGAQLEAGAFATSYIPTVASTVTRSADVASMTGTNFSSWYNQSEGSFVVDTSLLYVAALVNSSLYQANAGATGSNRMGTNFLSADTFFFVASANVAQASISTGVATANTPFKIANSYKQDDFASCRSGGIVATDTSGLLPVGVDRLAIGSNAQQTMAFLNGHIRSIAYYNTRLSNAVLQGVTK